MPALFDRATSSERGPRSRGGPSKQWDAGLQQFVRPASKQPFVDGTSGTVPRVGAKAMERSPGPAQYQGM